MHVRMVRTRALLLGGAAVVAATLPTAALAGEKLNFNIPAQPLASALTQFGVQSGIAVIAPSDLTTAKTTHGFSAASDPDTALRNVTEIIERSRTPAGSHGWVQVIEVMGRHAGHLAGAPGVRRRSAAACAVRGADGGGPRRTH